jgi:hypothetical protein
MDKEIDIYEFEWWGAFIGLIVLFLLSSLLIEIQLLDLHIHSKSNIHNLRLIFTPIIFISLALLVLQSLLGMVILYFTPKMIIFRQNSITIIYAVIHEKSFRYEDISRLVIGNKDRFSFRSKTRLYFSGHSTMVFFNPDRMLDFSVVLETIRKKGLARIIEQN